MDTSLARSLSIGAVTPVYARISNYQNLGSQISVGLKGEW